MTTSNLCTVFRDVDDVEWPRICKNLHLTHASIDNNCLKHTLWIWYNNNKGEAWTTWRKLAIVIERIYGFQKGNQLKEQAGVGK